MIEESATLPEEERKKLLIEVANMVLNCNFEAKKCAAEIELLSEKKSNESKKRKYNRPNVSSRKVHGSRC